MTRISLGDMAQAFLLRRQNLVLKTDQQRQAVEMTTGRSSDAGRHLVGDFNPLAAMETSLSRLAAYHRVTSEAAGGMEAMQAALAGIDRLTAEYATSLITAGGSGNAASIAAAAREAQPQMEAVIAALNSRHAGQALFGGQATDRPALADAPTMLAALEVATAGAATRADLESAVDGWFADPAGFGTIGYLGAAASAPLAVAPGETVTLATTARDPALTDTLKALAMAALIDRGALAGSAPARAETLRRAGENLLASQGARAMLAADIGFAEGRVQQAALRNGAESTALEVGRSTLLAIDPYEAAVRLEATETQLETLYSITARINRLSLMDYLQ